MCVYIHICILYIWMYVCMYIYIHTFCVCVCVFDVIVLCCVFCFLKCCPRGQSLSGPSYTDAHTPSAQVCQHKNTSKAHVCDFLPVPLCLHQCGLVRLHCLHVGRRLHSEQLHQEGPDGGTQTQLWPQPLQLYLCGAPASLLHPCKPSHHPGLFPVSPPDLPLVSLLRAPLCDVTGLHSEAHALPLSTSPQLWLLPSSPLPPCAFIPLPPPLPPLSISIAHPVHPHDPAGTPGGPLRARGGLQPTLNYCIYLLWQFNLCI